MLLANLSLLAGAAARMSRLNALFGGHNLTGFFWTIFALVWCQTSSLQL